MYPTILYQFIIFVSDDIGLPTSYHKEVFLDGVPLRRETLKKKRDFLSS